MKKTTQAALVLLAFVVVLAGFSSFVKAGGVPDSAVVKTVADKKMAGPTFPHKAHLARGLKCTVCHSNPGTGALQASMNTKDAWHKACGDCHAGKAAAPDVNKDCMKCHK